jgi:hypothetical protein
MTLEKTVSCYVLISILIFFLGNISSNFVTPTQCRHVERKLALALNCSEFLKHSTFVQLTLHVQ